MPHVGTSPSLLSKQLCISDISLVHGLPCQEWGFGKTPSLLSSQCGPFILCCAGAFQRVFRCFPEGAYSHAGVDSCSWEEISSGSSSYAAVLNCLWIYFYFYFLVQCERQQHCFTGHVENFPQVFKSVSHPKSQGEKYRFCEMWSHGSKGKIILNRREYRLNSGFLLSWFWSNNKYMFSLSILHS